MYSISMPWNFPKVAQIQLFPGTTAKRIFEIKYTLLDDLDKPLNLKVLSQIPDMNEEGLGIYNEGAIDSQYRNSTDFGTDKPGGYIVMADQAPGVSSSWVMSQWWVPTWSKELHVEFPPGAGILLPQPECSVSLLFDNGNSTEQTDGYLELRYEEAGS